MKFPHKSIKLLPVIILLAHCFAYAATEKKAHSSSSRKNKTPTEIKGTVNFAPVDQLVQEQINDQAITGAVLVVGHAGGIVHQKAFGLRATGPPPSAGPAS